MRNRRRGVNVAVESAPVKVIGVRNRHSEEQRVEPEVTGEKVREVAIEGPHIPIDYPPCSVNTATLAARERIGRSGIGEFWFQRSIKASVKGNSK